MRYATAVLSCWLWGAHFFRSGQLVLTGIMILASLVLLIRRVWSVRVIQAVLGVALVEWFRTLLLLVWARRAEGDPWIRLALILGPVALLAGGSALALERSVALRRSRPISGRLVEKREAWPFAQSPPTHEARAGDGAARRAGADRHGR